MRAFLHTIVAALLCTGAVWAELTTVWAPGNKESYPYAHKYKPTSTEVHAKDQEADGKMCWAAAASNLIEYWQQRYRQLTGLSLPEGVPGGGTGSNRGSQVFDAFVKNWENTARGEEPGIYWYFSGAVNAGENEVAAGSGGFWADYCKALGYTAPFLSQGKSYYKCDFPTVPTAENPEGWKTFVEGGCGDFIKKSLEGGSLVAITVKSWNPSHTELEGHALTLYGADYDEKGTLVAVYINDNNVNEAGFVRCEVKSEKKEVTLLFEDKDKKENSYEKTIKYDVLSLKEGDWYISALGALDLRIVPEPSATALSLLALAGLVFRRRRAA